MVLPLVDMRRSMGNCRKVSTVSLFATSPATNLSAANMPMAPAIPLEGGREIDPSAPKRRETLIRSYPTQHQDRPPMVT